MFPSKTLKLNLQGALGHSEEQKECLTLFQNIFWHLRVRKCDHFSHYILFKCESQVKPLLETWILQMLVIKLGDKKQYLTLIIINVILLFLIPHHQTQRRELRLSVRNKDAGSGPKDGSQELPGWQITQGRLKNVSGPKQVWQWTNSKDRISRDGAEGGTQGGGWEVMEGLSPCPTAAGKDGTTPGAAGISLRQPWHCWCSLPFSF